MRSKRLRHTIEIQERSQTPDTHGQLVDTWSEHATVRALVEPLMGRELFAAQQMHSEVNHRIRLRYVAGITGDMRIVYDSRTFAIKSIIQVKEREREMVLMVYEGVTLG